VKKYHLSLKDEDYSQLNAEHKAKDKEVKRLCKEDKTRWIKSKLQEAETAAAKSDSLDRTVKELSGKPRGHMPPVRKLDNSVASTHADQHQCWETALRRSTQLPRASDYT